MHPESQSTYLALRRLFLLALYSLRLLDYALTSLVFTRKRRLYQWYFRMDKLRLQLQSLSKEKQPIRYWLIRRQYVHARYSWALAYGRADGTKPARRLHRWLKPLLCPVAVLVLLVLLLILLPVTGLLWYAQRREGRKSGAPTELAQEPGESTAPADRRAVITPVTDQ